MRLYHGSDVAVETPRIAFNKGFADLGQGFYLTDDCEAATRRARSRAHKQGRETGAVSVYDFDEEALPWVCAGSGAPAVAPAAAFGLCFDDGPEGIAAWARYIQACRKGETEIAGVGRPSVVRAWIATEEIEMVCAGFISADELAEVLDTSELIVQYCFADQDLMDCRLAFVQSFEVR